MRNLKIGCSSVALIMCLSGCGGGSGVQSTPPPPPDTSVPQIPQPATKPTTENFDTPEFEFSTSAKNSNVLPAWQAGASGEGVKIGIVDSGITSYSSDFAGKIDPASRDFGGSGSINDEYGHGTAVASIAAGARDGTIITGIAYDSTLVVMKVAPAGCEKGCSYDSSAIAQGIKAAAAAGAKVINLSIGGDSAGSSVEQAVRDAARSGAVIVVSAGNETANSPSGFARDIESAAPGQVIIVGALGANTGPIPGVNVDYNQMWAQSNWAGISADWYIGAPGYAIEVAYQHGYDQVSGTSFAAPAVSGAIAVMMQAFPNLTSQQIVQILLTTADDLGFAGVDTEFGHGRLDVGRAFQPIGATHMAGRDMIVSTKFNGSAPAVVGDALTRGSLNAVVLDAYQRAFTVNLARTLASTSTARPLASAVASRLRNSSLAVGPLDVSMSMRDANDNQPFGFSTKFVGPFSNQMLVSSASLVSHLGHGASAAAGFSSSSQALRDSLAGSPAGNVTVNQDVLSTSGFAALPGKAIALRQSIAGMGLSVSREIGAVAGPDIRDPVAGYRLSTLALDKNFGALRLVTSVSRLNEESTVLGGRLGTVFGRPGAKTLFVDAEMIAPIGSWSLLLTGRKGWTHFGAGSFSTSGYSLRLDKSGVLRTNDSVSLLVSQPLRVSGGGFSMMLPRSYDYATSSPVLGLTRMDLTPSGREIDAEAAYARYWRFGSAGFNLYVRRQPGHFANASADVGGAFRLNMHL